MPGKQTIPILLYHKIAPPSARGTSSRSLYVHPKRFASQMRWLKAFGFKGLSMADLKPYFKGEKTGRVFGLTFDDGYCNVLENAAPLLGEIGFTATNYFVSGHVGDFNAWDRKKNIPQLPLMDGDKMREWVALGHEAGAHTVSHPRLTDLDGPTARAEIEGCKSTIEEIIGGSIDAFCYPHGAFNEDIKSLVAQAGYENATTTAKAHVSMNSDPFALPRITVRRTDPGLWVLFKCLFAS